MFLSSIKYCRFKGQENEWLIWDKSMTEPIALQDINLVMGKNATGKSHFLNVIRDLSDLFAGVRKLSQLLYNTSSYDLLFTDNGDGDFRSSESIELLKQSDIIVTNPPFSLFREFVGQLVKYDKQYLIIGNINVITYKEIFKLIKENKAWLGINLGRGVSGFIVPEHYELYGTEARIDSNGNRIVSPNNCLWLTNIDNFKRHEDIKLKKKYFGNERNYPKYDNYDGINVNKTEDIPLDYGGHIGVPITFLHKFNPDQFEIIKFRKGNDDKDLSIEGKCPYFRILIRNKRLQNRSLNRNTEKQ